MNLDFINSIAPLHSYFDCTDDNLLNYTGPNPDFKDCKRCDLLKAAEPNFQVSIALMRESHRETHWVQLQNLNLPHSSRACSEDAPGYITPYMSETREHAEHTAAEWAAFLGVPEQAKCTCIMCDHTKEI